jgi:hypothetical protein
VCWAVDVLVGDDVRRQMYQKCAPHTNPYENAQILDSLCCAEPVNQSLSIEVGPWMAFCIRT